MGSILLLRPFCVIRDAAICYRQGNRPPARPAIENLMLSTSAQVRALDNKVAQLPLRPSRGNYHELGATKELFKRAHLSANVFFSGTAIAAPRNFSVRLL